MMLHDRTYLARRMNQEPVNRSLGIVLLLEIDKRLVNCTQLTLVVEKKAALPNFKSAPNFD